MEQTQTKVQGKQDPEPTQLPVEDTTSPSGVLRTRAELLENVDYAAQRKEGDDQQTELINEALDLSNKGKEKVNKAFATLMKALAKHFEGNDSDNLRRGTDLLEQARAQFIS